MDWLTDDWLFNKLIDWLTDWLLTWLNDWLITVNDLIDLSHLGIFLLPVIKRDLWKKWTQNGVSSQFAYWLWNL